MLQRVTPLSDFLPKVGKTLTDFSGELTSVPIHQFQPKLLHVENMILVQDKGTWSQTTCAEPQPPAVPTVYGSGLGGRIDH